MTLDQIRAELERGPLSPSTTHCVDMHLVNDRVAEKLHVVATKRAAGVRLQLPVSHMPVLP
ncbi:hypothetical protein [Caballeronia sp. dw_19]|uniref:hypothetical protein n=1 Tax=Caballeronia sp. dw_19 TaxID=2719791 RepID=UPI002106279D|nr:hypothetical protein [Caballeronia sp. dw_19]